MNKYIKLHQCIILTTQTQISQYLIDTLQYLCSKQYRIYFPLTIQTMSTLIHTNNYETNVSETRNFVLLYSSDGH